MPLRLRRLRKTEQEKQQMAELFRKGYAADSIAEQYQCSESFVYKCASRASARVVTKAPLVLDELPAEAPFIAEVIQEKTTPVPKVAKVTTGKKRGPKAGFKPFNTISDDKRAEIIKLITTTELSQGRIAKQVGVGENTVWRAWTKARKGNPELKPFKKPADPEPVKVIKIKPVETKAPVVTDKQKAEVIRHHRDNYYSASTIAQELGIDIADVVEIIKEDKLNQ